MLARTHVCAGTRTPAGAIGILLQRAALLLLPLLVALLIPVTATCSLDENGISITEVTERILVFDTGRSAVHSNVIVIDTRGGLVVVDTHDTPASARRIRNAIEERFEGKSILCVINTHHVIDHTAGNWVFQDVPIIGHTACIAGMSFQDSLLNDAGSRAKALEVLAGIPGQLLELEVGSPKHTFLKEIVAFYEGFFNAYPVFATTMRPTVLFDDRMALNLGDTTIELIYSGGLYSVSDIVIHIPEEQVVIVGDLFQKDRLPVIGRRADVDRCIAVMEEVIGEGSEIEWVIPGHYETITVAEARIQLDYLKQLSTAVTEAKKSGTTVDGAKEELSIGKRFSRYADYNRVSFFGLDADHARNVTTLWGLLD